VAYLTNAHLSFDGRTLIIHVPMTIKTGGGCKLVISPNGVPSSAKPWTRFDTSMAKAPARAFRWRKPLENGVYSTVGEIAAAEKINTSYVSRILRLALPAPEIIEMIVDGCQPAELTLAKLTKPFPLEWKRQMRMFDIGGWITS